MRRAERRSVSHAGLLVLLLLLAVLAGILLLRILSLDTQTAEPAPAATESVTPEPSAPEEPAVEMTPPAAAAQPLSNQTPEPTVAYRAKGYTEQSYALVNDLVYTYAHRQRDGEAEIRTLLEKLEVEDPALADLWTKILETWDFVNTQLETPTALPDGLPTDDSLCIVVLGFQLLPDGGMSDELVGRCETALACAEQYPQARIAVTGGGTAWQNRSVTEAGRMAEWLIRQGIAEDRILIEARSLTTADNAVFTAELLREQAPEVKTVAVVSSDYHLPLGWLLFEETALVREYEMGELPFSVAACAAYPAPSGTLPDTPVQQLQYLWSVADPKY